MKRLLLVLCLAPFGAGLIGCASVAPGDSAAAKRESIQRMHDQSLDMLYAKEPKARDEVANSACYAVFNDQGGGFLLGLGGGYGMAKSKDSAKPVYMQMFQASVGLGIGYQGYRTIVIINDPSFAQTFLDGQWVWGAAGDIGIRFGDTGGILSGHGFFDPAKVYRIDNNGIIIRGSLPMNMYSLYTDIQD